MARTGHGPDASTNTGEIDFLRRQLHTQHRRSIYAVAGAGFMVSAAVAFGMAAPAPGTGTEASIFGWIAGLVGLGLLIRAWPGRGA
jgi:hypothetical protein